jgi:hypothetical protein
MSTNTFDKKPVKLIDTSKMSAGQKATQEMAMRPGRASELRPLLW